MTDQSGSSTTGSEEAPVQYQCKRCGETCTEENKEAHRASHNRERQRQQRRVPSVPPSEGTMFMPVADKPPAKPKGKPRKKRPSQKKYDRTVKHTRQNSG